MSERPTEQFRDPEQTQDALAEDLLRTCPSGRRALIQVLDRHIPPDRQLYLLRELVFGAADAICITDGEGRLLVVNRAFCELAERPMGEVVGRKVAEVVPIDPDRFEQIGEQLLRGEAYQDYEFILPRDDDRPPRVLSISLTPIADPQDGVYRLSFNVARDLTGRRELERQVKEWQERARGYLYALHPPEIAEAIVEGRLAAQNLSASVLFADVAGFTRYTSQSPPAEVAGELHRYFTAMTQIVLDHQGWVDKFVGDSLMALFGVPGGSPEHAIQALRAAHDMTRVMKLLDLPWRHKVGIATGQVIAGDIGSRQKPTYTAIGDPVNLASRLVGTARPGEVLACPRTHASVGGLCAWEPLGELDIRGYGSCEVFRLLPD